MSMHKIPLSKVEQEGLKAHHLPIGTPSQLSDSFRLGIAWARKMEDISTPEEYWTAGQIVSVNLIGAPNDSHE